MIRDSRAHRVEKETGSDLEGEMAGGGSPCTRRRGATVSKSRKQSSYIPSIYRFSSFSNLCASFKSRVSNSSNILFSVIDAPFTTRLGTGS